MSEAVGFEPVASVARRSSVTTRCMRRRLTKAATRLRQSCPTESPLLVKFGTHGWFLDRSVAYRHYRGLVVPGVQEPWEVLLQTMNEMRAEARESQESLAHALEEIDASLRVLRCVVGASDP